MKVELRSIESVRPYEQNPRLNDQAVEAVAKSLRKFGFRQLIVVGADGVSERYHEAPGNLMLHDVYCGQRKGILKRRGKLETQTLARRRRQNQGKPGPKEPDRTEKTSLAPKA